MQLNVRKLNITLEKHIIFINYLNFIVTKKIVDLLKILCEFYVSAESNEDEIFWKYSFIYFNLELIKYIKSTLVLFY